MFYDTSQFKKPLEGIRDDRSHALVVLNPAESKRLIAKGLLEVPEVKRALQSGWFVISRGITPAYVLEEITGETYQKEICTAGLIVDGRLASVNDPNALGPFVFRNGQLSDVTADEALSQFKATDVSIKGANAIDPAGNVGVLAANPVGGTVGGIWPTLAARGCHWITPVSLERLVPSVQEAAAATGNRLFDYVMGSMVGLMQISIAKAVTEIQALELLTGVTVVHVASGGVAGSEGAVILALEGDDETVRTAFELVESIKGEEPIPLPNLSEYVREPAAAD